MLDAQVCQDLHFCETFATDVCLVKGLADLCSRLPLHSFSRYLDGNLSQGIFREPRREATCSIHAGKGRVLKDIGAVQSSWHKNNLI